MNQLVVIAAASVLWGSPALVAFAGINTWTSYGPHGGVAQLLAIDPVTPATLYAGIAPLDEPETASVFKSTDGGEHWRAINTGLGDLNINALVIDRHAADTLYAGTATAGVFRSTDAGSNWTTFNSGLPIASYGVAVAALATAPTVPPALYAGTNRGVFGIQTASFTVNSTDDLPDAAPGDGVCASSSGDCTLHAAIEEANGSPASSAIVVPAGTYRGGFAINVSLTLIGAGAASTRIDGGGASNHSSAIHVGVGADVAISGVTIQNGCGDPDGGGIFNAGTLTLSDAILTGNTALPPDSRGARGGGLYNAGIATLSGKFTISDNTFESNYGPLIGGGIFNAAGAMLALTDCTLNANSANGGGGGLFNSGSATLTDVTISRGTAGDGIDNSPGNVTLTNVTISDNAAYGISNHSGSAALTNVTTSGNELGIYNSGTMTVTNGTISDGMFLDGRMWSVGCSTLDLKNTIVTGTSSRRSPCTFFTDDPPACSGTITSLGHNLSSDRSCGFTAIGDVSEVDPQLGPLQDNGGPTSTHALLPGSPAIDAGSPGCPPPATDQRGVRRPQGAACDIGAYEFAPLRCGGDCNQNGEVSVDELVRGVNITLGNLPLEQCVSLDTNGNHLVTVDELVAAVTNALNGCAVS